MILELHFLISKQYQDTARETEKNRGLHVCLPVSYWTERGFGAADKFSDKFSLAMHDVYALDKSEDSVLSDQMHTRRVVMLL